jgi:hypothetical protein
MKLPPKQREMLARAVSGEDRQIPEFYDPGPPPWVQPARRWFVPAGFVVPSGSNEYQACRALAARGLLKSGGPPRSPQNPYGLGGYRLTTRGKAAL